MAAELSHRTRDENDAMNGFTFVQDLAVILLVAGDGGRALSAALLAGG
jgi:hypothetical protein